MTKKTLGELRGIAPAELKEKMAGLKADLAKERAVIASGTRPENPGKIRKLRRTLARILTILREKEVRAK